MTKTSAKKMMPSISSQTRKGNDDERLAHNIPSNLLPWYDRHRRSLPWRAGQGNKPDPYHVWLSEIMLQQTVVAAVKPYFERFIGLWPDIHALAAAAQDDIMREWAGLGYYARARNLHKCAKIISEELGGDFPSTQADLKKLPGIGDYTSAAITAIAFDKPATVIDGNVERVISRVFAITEPLPGSKTVIREKAALVMADFSDRPSDLSQAFMDLGATICTPKTPKCSLCPLQSICRAYHNGQAEDLPARAPKKARAKRYGHIYLITDKSGNVLLERRPEKGLLGGMTGFPTGPWPEDKKDIQHIDFIYDLKPEAMRSVMIKHSFTHFDLELYALKALCIARGRIPENYFWAKPEDLHTTGFPTLFRKFYRMIKNEITDVPEK